jgi:transposase
MAEAIGSISIQGFGIDVVMIGDRKWTVSAHATAESSPCPQCQQQSGHVHQYYSRTLRDLPVDGQGVELVLQVRRLKCMNKDCPQTTFAERLPGLAEVHAQRTCRFREAIREIGFVMSGEAGAALAGALHMHISGDTLLRIVHRTPEAAQTTPRVLGVDDWAYRKGQVYGTILIDQERHCPVDLLEGRTAAGLTQWLQKHPGVEIMTRDRSTEFRHGMNEGNPGGTQVADRWHLLHNLRESLERMFQRIRQPLVQLPLLLEGPKRLEIPVLAQFTGRTTHEEAAKRDKRAQRKALFDQVKVLRKEGSNILQIAKRLKMSRITARKFFYADDFPERSPHRRHKSILDPYAQELQVRWDSGCHNRMELFRHIQSKGYQGSYKPVLKWVRLRRVEPAATTHTKYLSTPIAAKSPSVPLALPSAKKLSWLLVRDVDALDEDQVATLKHVQQNNLVARAYLLVQEFRKIVRQHVHESFDTWLTACETSSIPDLVSFSAGLRNDYSAVFAALKTGWSNGQTEGQVNRLKMIKRSMYGRASFKLLRLKVIHRRC